MFSPDITESDDYLEMPGSSQNLYFHLGMNADDDGFVNPKKIMRMIGATEDDLKILIVKRFVLPFKSGVVVIKHWLIHNLIRKDRYKETRYLEEKNLLKIKENGAYTEVMPEIGCQNDNQMATQVRLGEVRIGKDREEGSGDIAAIAAPTPRQEFLDFIKRPESEIQRLIAGRGVNSEPFIRREVEKFISKWTERTASGKKQKWELEKTFELRKRLTTWLNNAEKWSKDKPQTFTPDQSPTYKTWQPPR